MKRGRQTEMGAAEARGMVLALCKGGKAYASLSDLVRAAAARNTAKRLTPGAAARAVKKLKDEGRIAKEGNIRLK